MPEIPRYSREVMPSGRVSAVPIPFDVANTGQGQIGAGLADLGQGIMKLGSVLAELEIRKQEIRIDREYTKGRTLMDTDDRNALEGIYRDSAFQNENDIAGYFDKSIKAHLDSRKTIIKNSATSEKSREALDKYAELSGQGFVDKAKDIAWSKEKDWSRSMAFTAADEQVRLGNAGAAESILRRAMVNEYVGLEEGEAKIGGLKREVDWYVGAKMAIENPQALLISIEDKKFLPNLELKDRLSLKQDAQQSRGSIADQFAKNILAVILDADKKNLSFMEKENLALDLKSKIPQSALSGEQAKTWVDYIDKWSKGKEENNSIVYTNLFREVTQLHRGIGKTEKVRKSITDAFVNLDPAHFESLNKYLDETVEEWNADTLRRLEKEAIPHLAPRLAMVEKWMEMAATPGISAQEKAKYDNLIERLQEPAKVDADRLALYLDQSRKWIAANPNASNFYENGRRIMAQFERYTDDQIRQMEKQLESNVLLEQPETQEIPIINFDIEYNTLPTGTVYKDPQGNLRRKK